MSTNRRCLDSAFANEAGIDETAEGYGRADTTLLVEWDRKLNDQSSGGEGLALIWGNGKRDPL